METVLVSWNSTVYIWQKKYASAVNIGFGGLIESNCENNERQSQSEREKVFTATLIQNN